MIQINTEVSADISVSSSEMMRVWNKFRKRNGGQQKL